MMTKSRHFIVLAAMCLFLNGCSSSQKSAQTAAEIQAFEEDEQHTAEKIVVKKVERKAGSDTETVRTSEESMSLLKARNADEIASLLKKHADVNYHDAEGETALMRAVERDDIPAARKLIEAGALVNALNKYAMNALFYAKSVTMARLLLDNGADIHQTALNGSTVLHDTKLSPDLAHLYIKHGADLFAQNGWDRYPIHYARDPRIFKEMLDAGVSPNQNIRANDFPLISAQDDESVKLLLDAGADPNIVIYGYRMKGFPRDLIEANLLHTHKDGKAIARLIKAGLNPKATDYYGVTPLHVVQTGEGARALIQAGANVNALDKDGWSPLMVAKKADVVQALIKAGADAKYINNKSKYDIYSALFFGQDTLEYIRSHANDEHRAIEKDTDAVKALIKAGVDVNAPVSSSLRVPLHVYENEETFAALLAAGADVHKLDDSGRNALHHQTNPANVKALIEAGVDVNARDHQGKTPIFYQTNPESLKMLINAGAALDVTIPRSARGGLTSEIGNTVLFYHSDPECIRMLVNAGASINPRNLLGNTPLHEARSLETIQTLLALGADTKVRNEKDQTAFDSYDPVTNRERYTEFNGVPPTEDEFIAVAAAYLKAGMNPNAYDPDGAPLLLSFIRNHSTTAVELLLKSGANPSAYSLNLALSREGVMPESTHTLDILRLLLKYGADPNQTDDNSMTPLMLARSLEAVSLLIDAGANLNAVDSHNDTALTHYKQSDAADLLIDKGIDITNVLGYAPAPDPHHKERRRIRDTDLHSFNGPKFDLKSLHTHYSASNIKRLLKRGVDLKQTNDAGETILMRAIDEEGVKLLLDAGADGKAATATNRSARHQIMHRDGFYPAIPLSPETQLRLPTTIDDELEYLHTYPFFNDISSAESQLPQSEKDKLNELNFQSIHLLLREGYPINVPVYELLRRDASLEMLKKLKAAKINIASGYTPTSILFFASDADALKFLKQESQVNGKNRIKMPNRYLDEYEIPRPEEEHYKIDGKRPLPSSHLSYFMNKSADAAQFMIDELNFAPSATLRNGTPRDAGALKVLLNAGAAPFDKTTILKFINDPAALKLLINAGAFSDPKSLRRDFIEQLIENLTNPESAQILIDAGDKSETPKPMSAIHFQKFGFMEYALIHAANADVARVFIKNGALDAHDDELPNPLLAQQHNPEIFDLILSKKSTIPEADAQKMLTEAVNPRLIELLLKAGADPAKSPSPLLTNQLSAEAVNLHIKAGADPNASSPDTGYALMYQQNIESKRALIKAGARVDARNLPPRFERARRTPLNKDAAPEPPECPVMATSLTCADSLETAKFLVEAGADVNAMTDHQITPLMFHAQYGHDDIVKYLLDHGADPWIRSANYETAYDFATTTECRNMLKKAMK